MFRALYSQMLYWLALRFQVVHPISGNLYRVGEISRFELWKARVNTILMNKSNRILNQDKERDQMRFAREQKLKLVLGGVSHDPNRKDPSSSVL